MLSRAKMVRNYSCDMYVLEDLNLSTFSFKCTSQRMFHAAHPHVMLAGAIEGADRTYAENQIVEN